MKFAATLVSVSLFLSVGVNALPGATDSVRRSVASLAALQDSKKTVFESCSSDSQCQQGCCGFSSGKCAGPGIAQTNGSGGCGHGSSKPNCNVASALKLGICIKGAQNGDLNSAAVQQAASFTAQLDGLKFTPSSSSSSSSSSSKSSTNNAAAAKPATSAPKSVSALAALQKSKKTVFETCSSDSQCQQGCCGFSTGKCAGPGIAQTNGSGGCGRGDAKPNCDVASALKLGACIKGAQNGDLTSANVQQAAAFTAQLDGFKFNPA